MPNAIIKHFSDKSNKSVEEVEKLWNEAKKIAKKEYPDVKITDDKYYAIVVGILKKMLGFNEDVNPANPAITTSTMGDYVYKPRLMLQKRFEDKSKKKKSKAVGIFDPPWSEVAQ